ncbi:uncharacterized protein LOC113780495 [Coffea eugenioides]|uniref:uncharacterized protein LOC113780495 n=1 Tax=Coffea eugenioides TaxID=49369 RepID=UPI000F608B35|nr:uncharacterized protein LOC113780495 [Coffea eugenioides]
MIGSGWIARRLRQALQGVAELRSFLGLANYYRRFIKEYSKMIALPTNLLRKDRPWLWDYECEDAFRMLKKAIASASVLQLPDFTKAFEVYTDALDHAIGGVFMQDKHPIAFETRKLKECEQRYSTYEKEMMAIIAEKVDPKASYWQEFLAEFDFDWIYKPGKENVVADTLSRKYVEEYVAALSTYAVFVGAPKACLADVAAELFFRHVMRYFGLSKDIISDRNTRFTGITRRQVKKWLELLDAAQFCYNLHKSSTTKLSPFELVNGQQPLTPHEVALHDWSCCPVAHRFAHAKEELEDETRDSLLMAQQRMKKYADQQRRDLEFHVRDQVILKLTPQIWKKVSSKTVHRGFIPKYDRPFEVIKKVGCVTYRLKLPDRLKIYPIFRVSFLKPFNQDEMDDGRRQAKCAPLVIRKQFQKDMEAVLDYRTMGQSKKNRRIDYLIY